MLKEYPKFQRGEIDKVFSKLPKIDRTYIGTYLGHRKALGLSDTKSLRRYVIQVRHTIGKHFEAFKDYEEHTKLINLIMDSHLSKNVQFNLFVDLNNLFDYTFPEMWKKEARFSILYVGKKGKGKKKEMMIKPTYNDSDIPTDQEIDKMLQSEQSLFWKTFLMTLANSGNRQIENRTAENKNIFFDKDGTGRIDIFMTKNGKRKIVFLDVKTTAYIKKLQEEQKNENRFGKYLFQSQRRDGCISKFAVNDRIGKLSEKAVGRRITPHLFRYRKATELYGLAKNNKISESTALSLMGHSRSMMDTYNHLPPQEEINILKAQAFNPEISEDKKHALELEIEDMKKGMALQQKELQLVIAAMKNLVPK